jgi:hypothetical protein
VADMGFDTSVCNCRLVLIDRYRTKSRDLWRLSVHSSSASFNASGWNVSLTGNFKHFLGITGDFSGAYKDNVNVHTYTVGPVLTARLPVVQPFVHALFGGITTSTSRGASDTGFAMLVGGGIDLGLRKGIGFRILQVDWLSTRVEDNTNNSNFRTSAGLVIKF